MSILAKLVRNDSPVPLTRTRGVSLGGGNGGANTANLIGKMGEVGTLFSIVNRLATSVASAQWNMFRKPADGRKVAEEDRVAVTKHAALDMWRMPNPFMSTYDLVEACQQHLELVGETYLIIASVGSMPMEIWPVRPDRMSPVPHPTKFLSGWMYTSPDGEKIPLGLDQVIQIKYPNPSDPYRGMGPVQSVLHDLDSTRYSALWNRNFFINSAEPGGIVEVERRLSDEEFDELRVRWNEQHRGVNNAHRIAILEHGKYVPRSFTMRDMQFVELREVSRNVIMEAFGISRHMLGITEDVNRANAEAGIFMFAKYLEVPRLNRWRQALNMKLLPQFGSTSKGVEFDFVSPVQEDSITANATRDSKVKAVVAMVTAGFDAETTLSAFGMPEIPYERPEPPAPLPSAGGSGDDEDEKGAAKKAESAPTKNVR